MVGTGPSPGPVDLGQPRDDPRRQGVRLRVAVIAGDSEPVPAMLDGDVGVVRVDVVRVEDSVGECPLLSSSKSRGRSLRVLDYPPRDPSGGTQNPSDDHGARLFDD